LQFILHHLEIKPELILAQILFLNFQLYRTVTPVRETNDLRNIYELPEQVFRGGGVTLKVRGNQNQTMLDFGCAVFFEYGLTVFIFCGEIDDCTICDLNDLPIH
jgi:hypothetical protein